MKYPAYTPKMLSEALKAARKELGATQAVAARKVGLLTKTVSALETAAEASSIGSLYKLLAALDLEIYLRPRGSAPGGRPQGEW